MKTLLSIVAALTAFGCAGALMMGGVFGGGAMINNDIDAFYADAFMYGFGVLGLLTLIFQIVGQIKFWNHGQGIHKTAVIAMFCGIPFVVLQFLTIFIILPD